VGNDGQVWIIGQKLGATANCTRPLAEATLWQGTAQRTQTAHFRGVAVGGDDVSCVDKLASPIKSAIKLEAGASYSFTEGYLLEQSPSDSSQ